MTISPQLPAIKALAASLDERAGQYRALRAAADVAEYLAKPSRGSDEEVLTEPILRAIIERVLGFPPDAYFEQLGRGGQKPDFTPFDLLAHPFVFDSKGTDENLAVHEPQIRRYMDQRRLDYGVLFNLRELRTYRRDVPGHDRALSFYVLPLWQVAHEAALPAEEVVQFERFCARFRYRRLTIAEKIEHVATQESWASRLRHGEQAEVDVEFLVERLRALSVQLADDAEAQFERLDEFLRLHPGRERRLLHELQLLALDIAPGTDVTSLPRTVKRWRIEEGIPRRVWQQYLLRVAYLALTRILLYRAWEDVQLVDEYLYDGGFGLWYERLGSDVRRVLNEAFLHGQEQYHWLFGPGNNYDWYRPRDEALVDVLYSLAPVPLGRLDADVLGALYETYVDEIDRDRRGQFFTPRAVVKFMLDRAGFHGPDRVFRIEGDERKPLHVLDFATGSGGFLVEAARRLIDEGGIDQGSPNELLEALEAIVLGFVGGEISPFPYYLTEVNVLLQVSRLLGLLRTAGQPVSAFAPLGVLNIDTLQAKSTTDASLDLPPELRGDHAELVGGIQLDFLPSLDEEKLETYRSRLRPDASFDLVVGNPPYVTEANNKPLFDLLKKIPAWNGIYRGKTDYLYYFIWLAVEKLAPGGRLCVITPAGWMNAGEADFLRKKLTDELRLDELFLFGSYRLFATETGAPTPTVESAILVATKEAAPKRHKLRVVALEDEAKAPRDRETLLEEIRRRAAGRAGRRGGIHVHDLLQASLRPEYPWPVKFGARDVGTRVVAHLQEMLDGGQLEALERSWKVIRGIETGADAYTRRIEKRLSREDRARLRAAGAVYGEAILELPAGAEASAPWRDHSDLLARSPEPTGILFGALNDDDYTSLVVARAEPSADVLRALDRWRPLLETRAEVARNPRRHWWETLWPRSAEDMAAPKVIALYRTDRGRFALDEAGEWQPSNKTTVVVGREPDSPVAYLCGLLNSELLDLWYAVRGKTPWHVRRNYEPKRMNEMPYRPANGDPRAEQVAELVRKIATNRRAVLRHRSVFRSLDRVVKDPWKTGPIELVERALISELPRDETVSVRLDSALQFHLADAGRARVRRSDAMTLSLRRGRHEVGRVTGDAGRLDLLERILSGTADIDVGETLLPTDLALFGRRAKQRQELVADLLAEGRQLVEEVERLVCALYEVPRDLTEQVVAHAVARAGRQ